MNKILFTAITIAYLSFAACTNSYKSAETTNSEKSTAQFSCPMHPEIVGNKGDKCSKCGMELTVPVANKAHEHEHDGNMHDRADTTDKIKEPESYNTIQSLSTQKIVNNYLDLKNDLAKDDSKGASNAANILLSTLKAMKINSLDAKKKKDYLDIAEDAQEHAEHIGDNSGKLDHQREHFALLSKDIVDLINKFGSSQSLYQDFCPMYDDGKGAYWVSEFKEIKNPYYGNKMSTCGSVKKHYN